MRRRNVAGDSADWNRAAPPVGQHMVRAGDVVAERGGRAGADEQAAGVPHPVRERLRLLPDELEVLGRDLLGERERTGRVARLAPAAPLHLGRRSSSNAATASSSAVSGERHQTGLSGPCSACAIRSSAISSGSAPAPAAITASSLGPAMPSIPTWPTTWRFASCTYGLPGPTITSTGRTDSVPYASAAIACAPPMR